MSGQARECAPGYSLAEIRNGTGFAQGVRFVDERDYAALADECDVLRESLVECERCCGSGAVDSMEHGRAECPQCDGSGATLLGGLIDRHKADSARLRAERDAARGGLQAIVNFKTPQEEWSGPGECKECEDARARPFAISRLCSTHYDEMRGIQKRNERAVANSHYALRDIARAALAQEGGR